MGSHPLGIHKIVSKFQKKIGKNRIIPNKMNLPNMNLEDFQMLAALTNAAAAAQQQNVSHYSRQSTPPISTTNSPKVSSNNTRTPTPTQNGIPQVQTSSSAGTNNVAATVAPVVTN